MLCDFIQAFGKYKLDFGFSARQKVPFTISFSPDMEHGDVIMSISN